MKRLAVLYPAAIFALITVAWVRSAPPINPALAPSAPTPSYQLVDYEYAATVRSVYDGDTITVDIDLGLGVWKHGEKIRLYGIDTPELRGAERTEGLKVRDWVRARIDGEAIVLRTIKDKKGKYGRLLGVVTIPGSETTLNDEMLRLGLAERVEY